MRSQIYENGAVIKTERAMNGSSRANARWDSQRAPLEPAAVDEAFADESTAAPIESASRRELGETAGVDDAHGPSPSGKGRLLQTLADQLATLESQQKRIRRLLEAVERAS